MDERSIDSAAAAAAPDAWPAPRTAPPCGKLLHAKRPSAYLSRLLWLFGPGRACTAQERVFLDLCRAFHIHGGLLRADCVAARMKRMYRHGAGLLALRVATGELIGFNYGGALWLPWMQFDPADMLPDPALARVATELAGVCDGWDLCCWLATPNASLGGNAPMDVVGDDPVAVLQAAREARFIIGG